MGRVNISKTGFWPGMAERLRDPLTHAIVALGITQIIAWGTTLYALGVLGRPIALDTGWSNTLVFGGLTAGLLASGIVSMPVGRWIDRRGAREVMSVGSALVALSLVCLAHAHSPAVYLAAWVVVGVAMRLTLYDAAFAALVQLTPSRGRHAISLLTLLGGLASTVLWPTGAALEFLYGWRTTLLIYAALNAFVCLPLHWFALRRREEPALATGDGTPASAATLSGAPPLEGASRVRAMLLFSAVMSANALVNGSIVSHIVRILGSTGIDGRLAVGLASFMGVAQVLARLVDLVFGRNLHAVTLGRVTIALMPVAFAVLQLGGATWMTAAAFVLLFGAANGLATIVRGAVPLALFGPAGYGEVLGKLAVPVLITNAVAPTAFAWLEGRVGMAASVAVLTAITLVGVAAMEIMARWYRRTQH